MKARIDAWADNGGDKSKLWESVKHAERREGVVSCADDIVKIDVDESDAKPLIKTAKTRVERDVERLNRQLDKVMQDREKLKKGMDLVLWRARLVELATERSEKVGECAWDQRLCFGLEEYADFGMEVLASYEEKEEAKNESNDDAMQVDGTGAEGEWWCKGKKKCERHAG
jgi:COMPASS component SPP1